MQDRGQFVESLQQIDQVALSPEVKRGTVQALLNQGGLFRDVCLTLLFSRKGISADQIVERTLRTRGDVELALKNMYTAEIIKVNDQNFELNLN